MKKVIAKNQMVEVVMEDKPKIKENYLLIKTVYSVISPGTELTLIGISQDREIHLGYSAVGVVEEAGENVTGIKVGDRIACYGAPYVRHSEYLLVPKTLCCKVPDNVHTCEAALGGIGAIAIHGLRTAKLQFGEKVVVVGLGVIGQLIAQIAEAAAYDVYAYDLSRERTELLRQNSNVHCFTNTEELRTALKEGSPYPGADAVLLCTGGKHSNLTEESLKWIRDKGKVVIVGDIEPEFPRAGMFAKEAEILIARAGGPGRYDSVFEKDAIDYPYGYVRWTEGRNMGEYLRLVSEKKINVLPYVKEKVELEHIESAYKGLINKNSPILTKIISYS
ncbi:zinc-binding alcohol dehydrogenase [Mesobacillus foraminis]|uniref:zinc-dependent alcohol dehydrogenase n=1 Tax=Mesobacillus foraminis TaxID=279826 RepID=UPI001BEC587C|nr:zinc-binding alcohol dehydrogenase [Mesobacillus foraminis]MBT2758044.1 zinc-binding alcohol dehydrogenase [Mesobacillus foraminis]